MNHQTLSDNELIGLLYSQEDRLPRAAVDEFINRKEQMVGPLSEIVSEGFNWTTDSPESWVPIHATHILGAIGGKEVVLPLLESLRYSTVYDCDWISSVLPSIFSKIGKQALEELKQIVIDKTSDDYTRAVALECLGAITISNPDAENKVFGIIGMVFNSDDEKKFVKEISGNVLLDFQRTEYKDNLLAFGLQERIHKHNDPKHMASFFDTDVIKAFAEGKDLKIYTRDWLSFYDEQEINRRQERWNKEDKERKALEPKTKIGRNDPCPCGSGKKYKKCCLNKNV
ncbi:MAG: SEC-C domain-containing protein [Proteobacteria bacterium]|nr:SEC-C domain-containing protein [Pseudomonadota bacterium]